MRRLLQLAKDHIILFGTAKFLAGLISGSQVRRAANRAH